MYKNFVSFIFFFTFSLLLISQTLKINAEDVWGEKINWDSCINSSKTILVQPISTSNCGYCLMDGYFVEKNYFENNVNHGGKNFLLCLFNPQLDIYAYTKHFKHDNISVLNYPLKLYFYHNNGFPALLAFRNGEQYCNEFIFPYFKQFDSLKSLFWSNKNLLRILTSDIRFAEEEIQGNRNYGAVCIVADNDTLLYEKQKKHSDFFQSFILKRVSEINDSDFKKNIWIKGYSLIDFIPILKKLNTPITFDNKNIVIGNYIFPITETKITTIFPNPLNIQKYIYIEILTRSKNKNFFKQHLDYCVFKETNDSIIILMEGFFKKNNNNQWQYNDSLNSLKFTPNNTNCKGICKIPKSINYPQNKLFKNNFKFLENTALGNYYSIGNNKCKFPSIASDLDNNTWITWEENGDIYLVQFFEGKIKNYEAIEFDKSDSYNPLITFSNNNICIFYLNNKDGFYKLYCKTYDSYRLTDEILVSSDETFDNITPSVFSKDNLIVVSWSEWNANMRILKYRTIENNILTSINEINLFKSSLPEYKNAWYAQFCIDKSDKICGVWNQHYPTYLGVYSSNDIKTNTTFSVTKHHELIDKCENGGYPSIICDNKNNKWYFWETSMFDLIPDIFGAKNQSIKACYFDVLQNKTSIPMIISSKSQTYLNQTPVSAIDNNGKIYVVWSGREREKNSNWGIYLSYYENNKWSKPLKISTEYENARSPKITINNINQVFVCWHFGIGDDMKIKFIELTQ